MIYPILKSHNKVGDIIFNNYLPLKERWSSIWTSIIPLHLEMLCADWLKLAQWFSKRRFLNLLSKYFHHFVIISLWKKAGPFIWTNLNRRYPRMLCARFDWTWPSGSGEEDEIMKSLRRRWRRQQRPRRKRTMGKFFDQEKLTWTFGSGELKSRGNKWFYHKLTCLYTFNLIYIFKANSSFFFTKIKVEVWVTTLIDKR